jgi:hypothetical protein
MFAKMEYGPSTMDAAMRPYLNRRELKWASKVEARLPTFVQFQTLLGSQIRTNTAEIGADQAIDSQNDNLCTRLVFDFCKYKNSTFDASNF